MEDARKFLSVVIASGLDFDMLTPDDVLRHASMEVLAHHLPPDCIAEVIDAALAAKEMSAELVLQTLGVETLAEHVPMAVLWNCVTESALNSLGEAPEVKAIPAAAPKAAAPKAAPDALVAKPLPAPTPAPVEAAVPEPAPVPAPAPEPVVTPAPVAAVPVAPAPIPVPKPAPLPDPAVVRKPNRSVDPPQTMDMQVTATTTSPAPVSPVEVVTSERMKTQADEDVEDVSYHDMDTSIGSLEPEIVEVEYGDENLSYGGESDEVTAFGQE